MVWGKSRNIYLVLFILIVLGILGIWLITKVQGNRDDRHFIAFDKEILEMEKYVEHHPRDVDAIWELAGMYFRINRAYEKADDLLLKILEIEPKNEMAMNLRGIIMIEQFNFSDAIEQYEAMLEINGNNPIALSHISKLYFISDREKAQEYAKMATLEEKRLVKQGKDDASIPFYEKWEELVKNFDGKFKRDPAAASLEVIEEGIDIPLMLEVCEYALESDIPSEPKNMQELLEKTGLLYTEMDMNKEAIDVYSKLVEICPEYGMGYILLADRAIKTNELVLIDAINNKIQDQQDIGIEKSIVRALVLHKEGNTEQAIEMLKGISTSNYEIFTDHILGMLYEQLGDKKNSIEAYDKVLNDSSNKNPDYWSAVKYQVKKAISGSL